MLEQQANKIAKLQDAIQQWTQVLATVDTWERLAADGNLTAMSNLISPDMAKKALDYNMNVVESAETELNAYHAISFTGSGHSYSFEESVETGNEATTGRKWSNDLTVGIEAEAKFTIMGFGADIDGNSGAHQTEDAEDLTIRGAQTTGTRGFELGDPDLGDKFVVDIYRDPIYNGFVFTTLRGSSKCPHEKNTYAREQVLVVAG
jgi:hypothetical protein